MTLAAPRTSPAPALDDSLVRARLVLMSAFAANGLLFSTWFSRLPALAARLHIPTSELGVVMIALTVSTLTAIPIAARRLPSWRATRIVRITAPLTAIAMLVAVSSVHVWQLALALIVLGSVNGVQGIGLNAHATTLTRLADRPWMPAMHGSASAAGVLGAAAGTVATAIGVPLMLHLLAVTGLCLVTGLAVSRQLPIGGGTASVRILHAAAVRTAQTLPRTTVPRPRWDRVPTPAGALRSRLRRQQLTSPDPVIRLLVGAGLGACMAEGALASFGIVLFSDYLGARLAVAAMAFTLFSVAMAVIRLGGGWITQTVGPRNTLALGGALTAVCGLVLSMHPSLAIGFAALAGAAVGIGCAVPVCFQLATVRARDRARAHGLEPDRAAAKALSRLSLATSGGYLSGGPLVGLAASVVGLGHAVLIVAVGGGALAGCATVLSRIESRGRSVITPASPDVAQHSRAMELSAVEAVEIA